MNINDKTILSLIGKNVSISGTHNKLLREEIILILKNNNINVSSIVSKDIDFHIHMDNNDSTKCDIAKSYGITILDGTKINFS